MNRVLVEVYFPSLAASFDIYIPDNVRFYQIADMIEHAVSRITAGKYIPSGTALLCDRTTGVSFDINRSAKEMCLHNGSKLMII